MGPSLRTGQLVLAEMEPRGQGLERATESWGSTPRDIGIRARK